MLTFIFALLLTQAPATPAAEPQQARSALAAAAIARSGDDIPPIPLEPGSTARGMAFDAFRLIALAAKRGAAAGAPLTVEQALALDAPKAVIVAHPRECGGTRAAPAAITMVHREKGVVTADGPLITGKALEQMLPGVDIPPGSVAAVFSRGFALPGSVSITYAGTACGGATRLPLTLGPPRKVVDFKPAWPLSVRNPPSGSVQVQIEATIGVDGIPVNLRVLSAPSEFNLPASAAVRQWRYTPATINGAPSFVPIIMTVTVTFSRG